MNQLYMFLLKLFQEIQQNVLYHILIHPNKEYAAYLVEEGKEKEINGFDNSVWKNFSSYKKTFRYLDGIKIELGKNEKAFAKTLVERWIGNRVDYSDS